MSPDLARHLHMRVHYLPWVWRLPGQGRWRDGSVVRCPRQPSWDLGRPLFWQVLWGHLEGEDRSEFRLGSGQTWFSTLTASPWLRRR